MFLEIVAIISLLAIASAGWLFYRARPAAASRGETEPDEVGRHDHARAYELAKAQAELQRWSGP